MCHSREGGNPLLRRPFSTLIEEFPFLLPTREQLPAFLLEKSTYLLFL